MPLDDEILKGSQQISTDSYAMSIGELASLYRNKELDIHPEFQRFFRWSEEQKSRFIESLLLGIPIPSIFVSQNSKGKWDVIDGLQRISTILEFMGELKDENDDLSKPLVLKATKYLPSLEGLRWSSPDEPLKELTEFGKLKIKRAKLDIKIVLNTSDSRSKYELFQRLNTGGSLATDQEVRNCIVLMINRDFYLWMASLRNYPAFRACLPLSDRQIEEQYDMELVTRFVILWNIPQAELVGITELAKYLTDKIVTLAESSSYDKNVTEVAFKKTFSLLGATLGEDSFRKYDIAKDRWSGAMLISMYEIVALGIGFNVNNYQGTKTESELRTLHKEVWQNPSFISGTGSGISASSRIPLTIPLGRDKYA